MSTSADRLYEIAIDAIAQQRATVDRARGAVAPVSAAAAAIAAALVKPAFGAPGTWQTRFALLGAVGAGAVLVCSVLVLLEPRRDLKLSFNAEALSKNETLAQVLGDDKTFQLALATYVSNQVARNLRGLLRIRWIFSLMLAALVLEASGLVTAAVLPPPTKPRCGTGSTKCKRKSSSELQVTSLRIGTGGRMVIRGRLDGRASGTVAAILSFNRGRSGRTTLSTPIRAGRFLIRARPSKPGGRVCEVQYKLTYPGSALLAPSTVTGRSVAGCWELVRDVG
ncbi:MAG TPA: hypothetical protein VMB05_16805 [Solirubrobacteraceae bacterium]|nr:hypothetical protein [Solirubrobacteraceae bacterium]